MIGQLIKQSFWIEDIGAQNGYEILKKIELAGRTCYKSEDKVTDKSAAAFVRAIIKNGHHSVIEHHNITVRIISNRGVTHELVRHRLAAYSQESTRYCNYKQKGCTFIMPVWWDDSTIEQQGMFIGTCSQADDSYQELLQMGWSPQKAREVLPNALKTEIVMTANLREWRHIFSLRCSIAAHPQMRALMLDGLARMSNAVPVVFDDLAIIFLSPISGEVPNRKSNEKD